MYIEELKKALSHYCVELDCRADIALLAKEKDSKITGIGANLTSLIISQSLS
ncbi:hypothetical protein RO3G_07233 [Rhizopus delemar RA 99-880]|uniref:Uncharacterized protein n=1 Tax=Rhizopus delemar (strain RA 99-880 / ATCC MYA-4621 / FGSC 9543 / NRRL 43880) TaxID=246409 RepID=I1C248_RHIO9|nr:hypothetical protein RO3G_07233 [Rhizopus delemar RA 99-880]|eukprot:EIE82528.1 hypothetical protein RO3G_07233 [Rhizopus delemar RA 99-880]